jgi:ribonucleoside-diphosphate reductase alpha chain
MTDIKVTLVERLARRLAAASQHTENPLTDGQVQLLLDKMFAALTPDEEELVTMVADTAVKEVVQNKRPEVTEVRPKELECDVVRFQNNKDKWVALVGLLNGYPYEIFTGLQDDEEGILLPKSVTKGKIIKQVNADGTKRYDFQFENTRGYKITVEGLSEKFNPEYWNYAKLISGVLRYRMPIEHVIKLVSSLQLQSESINTWKNGVERALKKYLGDGAEVTDNEDNAGQHPTA